MMAEAISIELVSTLLWFAPCHLHTSLKSIRTCGVIKIYKDSASFRAFHITHKNICNGDFLRSKFYYGPYHLMTFHNNTNCSRQNLARIRPHPIEFKFSIILSSPYYLQNICNGGFQDQTIGMGCIINHFMDSNIAGEFYLGFSSGD